MAVVKSVTIHSERPWSNGQVKRRYLVTLTDNNGGDHEIVTMPVKQLPADNGNAVAASHLQGKKNGELLKGAIVPEWQDTQADYDRISLGRAMLLTDVDEFYTYLPLFKAMEGRSGSNANQRAATLGVSRANYGLMADRFGDVQGVAFFLDNAKGQIWSELPEEFK